MYLRKPNVHEPMFTTTVNSKVTAMKARRTRFMVNMAMNA
jgi:hypothetical protein